MESADYYHIFCTDLGGEILRMEEMNMQGTGNVWTTVS